MTQARLPRPACVIFPLLTGSVNIVQNARGGCGRNPACKPTAFSVLSIQEVRFPVSVMSRQPPAARHVRPGRSDQFRMRLACILFIIPLVCGVALSVLAADRAFTSYASVKPVLDQPGDLLPAELRIP